MHDLERLQKRHLRHDQVDVLLHPEMLACAPAVPAQDTHGVGLVDQDAGVVFLGQRDDLVQGRDVPFHAEDAVDDDELALFERQALQDALQVGHVVVLELVDLRLGQAAGVDDAGVDQAVGDDGVAFAGHRGDDGLVGLEAGAHRLGRFLSRELGQPPLHLLVDIHRPAQETRSAGGHAVAVDGRLGGGLDLGVLHQPQVIVGADHDHVLAPDLDLVAENFLDGGEIRIEVGGHDLLGAGEGKALVE